MSLHTSTATHRGTGTASTKHLLLAVTISVTQFGAHQVTILLPWIYFHCSESTRHPYTRLSPQRQYFLSLLPGLLQQLQHLCTSQKHQIFHICANINPRSSSNHVLSSPSTNLPTRAATLSSAAGGLIFPVQRLRLTHMCSHTPRRCGHAQRACHASQMPALQAQLHTRAL